MSTTSKNSESISLFNCNILVSKNINKKLRTHGTNVAIKTTTRSKVHLQLSGKGTPLILTKLEFTYDWNCVRHPNLASQVPMSFLHGSFDTTNC